MNTINHLVAIGGHLLIAHDEVQIVREDTLFLLESIETKPIDTALEIGVGMGAGAVLIGKRVKDFYGVDINEKAVKNTIINSYLNDLDLSHNIVIGDCYASFERKFDLIFSNPPQLPTPPNKERLDWIGWANNGGENGRRVIDKIIKDASRYLNQSGRLYLLHFEICDPDATIAILKDAGFEVETVSTKVIPLGATTFERVEYITNTLNKKLIIKNDFYHHIILVLKATKLEG
jgi:release factor glutamine methyltransferase